jgi:hypothetical protein
MVDSSFVAFVVCCREYVWKLLSGLRFPERYKGRANELLDREGAVPIARV